MIANLSILFQSYIFFHKIVLLNPCFIFSQNLILSIIDKVTTKTYVLALFVPYVAQVFVVVISRVGELPTVLDVIDTKDFTQHLDHDKSSSILLLTKDQQKDL